ncbi:DUF2799 domain-containing protein [Microbulbifer sp. OS29]|uniref:DUF2799 domain-containing protein n=1 Tax=Microbulbifer okhotskensis TaxID=2926617 RepID=A0A9X2EUF2_9GAMM|nr:DUF2799 domain-containing protein [Microbulbifer okhotskensis]MCO1336051.1 DUF2799 domain-containing protein [Microbulbifer okhotskensis]
MKFAPGIILLALIALMISGCATMSEDECYVADWQAIGYEDGAAGRDLAHLGSRREACAKYGVSVNTSAYRGGRTEGLELFCTELRGFDQGRSGNSYSGVCPADLEGLFLRGFNAGQDLFNAKYAVETLITAIHDLELEREYILDDMTEIGAQLIDAPIENADKVILLSDIARLKVRHNEIGYEINDLQFELMQREAEYQEVLTRSPYL